MVSPGLDLPSPPVPRPPSPAPLSLSNEEESNVPDVGPVANGDSISDHAEFILLHGHGNIPVGNEVIPSPGPNMPSGSTSDVPSSTSNSNPAISALGMLSQPWFTGK